MTINRWTPIEIQDPSVIHRVIKPARCDWLPQLLWCLCLSTTFILCFFLSPYFNLATLNVLCLFVSFGEANKTNK